MHASPPRTVEQLLDEVEATARKRIAGHLYGARDDLDALAGGSLTRQHPRLAAGAAALAGALAAPLLLRLARSLSPLILGTASPRALRSSARALAAWARAGACE
jgi:hypothetical protein